MSIAYWTFRKFIGNFKRLYLQSLYREFTGWGWFWRNYQEFNRLAPSDKQLQYQYIYPCLTDKTMETTVDAVYYYQDAWAFERILARKPDCHVDIGSHHKFVSLLSKVVPVTMVDIRPLPISLSTLEFREGSILDLPYKDASVPSVSSICVIEHIGLGRYGDPIDPQGSEKAIEELKRILQPGGDIYISVPIDDVNRIYFNAHRAFTEEYLLKLFKPLEVIDKHYIYNGEFVNEVQRGFGIGCYHLTRLVDVQ